MQEIELLPLDVIQNNPFINHPIMLEQYLMVGSYNRVFKAKSQAPSPYYLFFIDILLKTISIEVASCLETVSDTKVESEKIASQIIEYAVELEKIV